MNASQRSTEKDNTALFEGALSVTNEALDKIRGTPFFAQTLSLMDDYAENHEFSVAVYACNSDKPAGCFTISMQEHHLEVLQRAQEAGSVDWSVTTEYLEDVIKESDHYIENPWRLDLDWLKQPAEEGAH